MTPVCDDSGQQTFRTLNVRMSVEGDEGGGSYFLANNNKQTKMARNDTEQVPFLLWLLSLPFSLFVIICCMYLFAFVFVAVDLYCSNQYGWKSSGEICVLWEKYADNMEYIRLICSHLLWTYVRCHPYWHSLTVNKRTILLAHTKENWLSAVP